MCLCSNYRVRLNCLYFRAALDPQTPALGDVGGIHDDDGGNDDDSYVISRLHPCACVHSSNFYEVLMPT